MITSYRHFRAACSVRRWRRTLTALRNRALIEGYSVDLVEVQQFDSICSRSRSMIIHLYLFGERSHNLD
jgi:hypothetical protein